MGAAVATDVAVGEIVAISAATGVAEGKLIAAFVGAAPVEVASEEVASEEVASEEVASGDATSVVAFSSFTMVATATVAEGEAAISVDQGVADVSEAVDNDRVAVPVGSCATAVQDSAASRCGDAGRTTPWTALTPANPRTRTPAAINRLDRTLVDFIGFQLERDANGESTQPAC